MIPDYKGGSLVNLMASIIASRGGKSPYKQAKLLPAHELGSKNVILLVLDGIGYEYLQQFPKSFLAQNCRGKITSVMPSTTSAAVTTFCTGLPPQQTGITGWFMHVKELGGVIAPLPFTPMTYCGSFTNAGIEASDLITNKPLANNIKDKMFITMHYQLIDSSYSRAVAGKAKAFGFDSLLGLRRRLGQLLKKPGKKYIYAYWPTYDSICHRYSDKSQAAKEHFLELDAFVRRLAKSLPASTSLIITADHGHMFVPQKNRYLLHKHPKLDDCLVLPPVGEHRLAYCYVRMGKEKEFLSYVKHHLKHAKPIKSGEAIKKGWFGLGKAHPKLHERVGDYILVMDEGWSIDYRLLGLEYSDHIGHHGGVSPREMFVPLCVVKK